MQTAKETLSVSPHRPPGAQARKRVPEDADAGTNEQGTPGPDEPHPTERFRPALTPATMNITQAAAYIGLAKSTLYTWRTRRPGFGPRAVKAGGALRYRRSDLDAWIEAHAETLELEVETDLVGNGGRSRSNRLAASGTATTMSRRSRQRPR